MPDVLFGFNQATLKPEARIRLAKVAGILLAHPDLHLQTEGFTDSIGSDEYNLQLSRRRAAAVRDFLISQGVQPGSIETQGYGKADPIASNATEAGRALNRRVDLVVSGASIGSAATPLPPGGTNANTAPTGGVTGATSGTQVTTPAPAPGTVAAPTTTQPPQ